MSTVQDLIANRLGAIESRTVLEADLTEAVIERLAKLKMASMASSSAGGTNDSIAIASGIDSSADINLIILRLSAILGELVNTKTFADLVVQDSNKNYFIRKEVYDQTTELTTVQFYNFNNTLGSPVGTVLPAKLTGSGDSIVENKYYATVAGTGFSIGDSISSIVLVDGETRAISTLGWMNITTGLPIAIPPQASIKGYEDLIEEVLTRISQQLPASLGSKVSAQSLPVALATDTVLPLPVGASTAQLQADSVAKLTSIDTQIVTLATAARQDASNTALGSINSKLTTPAIRPLTATDVVTIANFPTGTATATNQTTGNNSLSSIDAKTPGLGQAAASASVPVVLTATQITTLTPPAAITGFALDTTVNSLLKPSSTLAAVTTVGSITNALPTGANTIGAISNTGFNINGTLPGFAATPTVNIGTAPTIAVTGTFFQATQPVSVISLPLPTGSSTAALQTTGNTSLSNIDTKTPVLGQAAASASTPVVIASDQTVSTDITKIAGTAIATGLGAATAGTQRVALTTDSAVSVAALPGTVAADIAAIRTNTAKISQYQFTLVRDQVPTIFVARYDTATGEVVNFTLAGLSYTPTGAVQLNDASAGGGSTKVIQPNEFTAKTTSAGNWAIGDILTRVLIVDTATNTVTGTIWQRADGTILSVIPALGMDVDDTDKTQLTLLQGLLSSAGLPADLTATTDTGTFSLISLFKRSLGKWTELFTKLPTQLSASGRLLVENSTLNSNTDAVALGGAIANALAKESGGNLDALVAKDFATQTTLASRLSEGTAITGEAIPTGSGFLGWISSIRQSINLQAKLTDEQPVKYLSPPQIAGFDPVYDKLQVGTSRDKFREEFFTFDAVNNWEVIQAGTGQTVSTNGLLNGSRYLAISTGTTVAQETILLSRRSFMLPCKIAFGISISQRIVNQEFFVELVSVNSITGAVEVDATFPSTNLNNALNAAALKFDSTIATSNIYTVRGFGKSELPSANTGFGSTTAATGSSPNFFPAAFWEINADMEQISFAAGAIDSLAAPTALFKRTQQIVDPSKSYKIRIRARNLAVAPVSTTDFRIHFVRALDTTRFTIDFARQAGKTTDVGQSLPIFASGGSVSISGTANVNVSSGTVTANTSNIGALSTGQYTRFRAAVTNVVQTIKASPGNIYGVNIINTAGNTLYLKIFDALTVALGSTAPVKTFEIPANGALRIEASANPIFYCQTNSIKIAITRSLADNAVDVPNFIPTVELEYI